MLTFINTNTMTPPIAPVGLEYIAQAAIQAGIDVDILDLCLAADRPRALSDYFSAHSPDLIGLSLRNVDDCFWPSCRWFVPDLIDLIESLRSPQEVVLEIKALANQGIHVLHTCDAEFNLPYEHTLAVCHEIIRQGLAETIRWYAYLSVVPFDAALASAMKRAGCVGIDFTTDAACNTMLETYAQPYNKDDIARAVTLCKTHGLIVMTDLLLGGPGETPETLAETIGFVKQIDPDGVGAGLGLRIYPGSPMADLLREQGSIDSNPNIKRKYEGPVDLLRPTFYISEALGQEPGRLIKDLIREDPRFFEPMDESGMSRDHNYNDNQALLNVIEQGGQGAFWHMLLKARGLA